MVERVARPAAAVGGEGAELETAIVMVAHELRAPLLAVEETVVLVAARSEMSEEDRRLLELATIDLHRLAASVHGLLSWSTGMTSIGRRPTDLAGLLDDIAGSLSFEQRSDRVRVHILDRSEAWVDPLLARVAIENVVRNALIHGDPREAVDVTLDREGHAALVVVRDDGRGIPDEEREGIFDPFARGLDTRSEGFGLGLFIANRAVEAHGGSIVLEPASRGTVIRLEFPGSL